MILKLVQILLFFFLLFLLIRFIGTRVIPSSFHPEVSYKCDQKSTGFEIKWDRDFGNDFEFLVEKIVKFTLEIQKYTDMVFKIFFNELNKRVS